ncbi:MAG TPA: substrate-binding domain-containing protein, partial [Candidatus Brocadiia bacterium]|nr:substrate-binding domain-containing protein [Candidatus Brocadiia bacterium]
MAPLPQPSEAATALADRIRQDIREGDLPPHQPLPTYREMLRQYGVGQATLQDCLALLEREGLIYRRERSGVFVRARPVPAGASPALKCITFVKPLLPMQEASAFLDMDYLTGYTDALDQRHTKMRFVQFDKETSSMDSILWEGAPTSHQGCVLVDVVSARLMNALTAAGVRFVLQHHYHYNREGLPEHASVYVNQAAGVFDAVRHLIGLGHRRIGFLGDLPTPDLITDPYTGYTSALKMAGIDLLPRDMMLIKTDDPSAAVAPALDYLRQPQRPTAIFARTDAIGLGVIAAARELGLVVPRDLSVVGYNDQPFAAQCDPPLTTVDSRRRAL